MNESMDVLRRKKVGGASEKISEDFAFALWIYKKETTLMHYKVTEFSDMYFQI